MEATDRPYRKGGSFDQAYDEIAGMSGIQFDPLAVQAFMVEEKMLREMVEAKCMQSRDPAATSNNNNERSSP